MKIALYESPFGMPFWSVPRQPKELFDHGMGDRIIVLRGSGTKIPLRETILWPVLIGLELIDGPALAHVAAIHPTVPSDMWAISEKVHIQISTLPSEEDDRGIPLVVKGNNVRVRKLWEDSDNHTVHSLQSAGLYPATRSDDGTMDSFRWHAYFGERLLHAKTSLEARLKAVQEDLEAFEGIVMPAVD